MPPSEKIQNIKAAKAAKKAAKNGGGAAAAQAPQMTPYAMPKSFIPVAPNMEPQFDLVDNFAAFQQQQLLQQQQQQQAAQMMMRKQQQQQQPSVESIVHPVLMNKPQALTNDPLQQEALSIVRSMAVDLIKYVQDSAHEVIMRGVPAGPPGPAGPQGPKGEKGDPAPAGRSLKIEIIHLLNQMGIKTIPTYEGRGAWRIVTTDGIEGVVRPFEQQRASVAEEDVEEEKVAEPEARKAHDYNDDSKAPHVIASSATRRRYTGIPVDGGRMIASSSSAATL